MTAPKVCGLEPLYLVDSGAGGDAAADNWCCSEQIMFLLYRWYLIPMYSANKCDPDTHKLPNGCTPVNVEDWYADRSRVYVQIT